MIRGRLHIRPVAAAVVLAALFMVALVPVASAEQTIALSTGTVELALPAGGSASDKIAVANNGDEPLKAYIYTNDVRYDEAGQPEYVRPTGATGEYLKSPASWLSLRLPAETQVIANTPYIELDPGEEMMLDFEMLVPADAPPGDYNAIIFFEMFDDSSADGTSSKISGRIGARIVVRVAGEVVERLDVAPFWVRGLVIGDSIPYEFTLTNEGNIDKRFVPSLVVLDRSEAEVAREQLEETAIVYAANARKYSGAFDLDKPLVGQYTLRAEMAYESESGTGVAAQQLLEKDRTFWIVPLWLAIVIILAVSLPLLWLLWRSTTRGRGTSKRSSRRGGSGSTMTEDVEPAGTPAAKRAEDANTE